ncbi:carboxypeptidase-like regulatory domain-containing protein [Sulfurimonas marina]|uniref:TonB-dependent receptor plug domain-containing protein n=1 Tax=Sulfurimonas marina TaxID=2590551 RepID=A0A7M1AX13_9BACT|nr:carboxypeptidase-like regulatory domain-containing protein [Sulfurimonas marina]QOP42001.1 hypothetical protein FJR03_09730 [Sulfurimonas marina]
MKKIILFFTLFVSTIFADSTGSASIFVFFNDTPLQNNEVLVDGVDHHLTDEDGVAEIILDTGKHKIEIFAKDGQGKSLGYVRRSITIKESRDTQVIATFTGEASLAQIDIDSPIGDSVELEKATIFGTLEGVITSSETSKPIPNVRVFLKGSSAEAKTDKDGKFSLQIPADRNVSVSMIHSEYSSLTLTDLVVKKDQTIHKAVSMTPASMELEEFIVLAPQVQGSIASILAEEKEAAAVTNIIGAEQISKQGDSDAAGAIKRVTGVTLVDGTDVYVRGLGGRYSNVEMNSLPLPSPDPQRRTVPLDIFPSAVIGSMKVQKSATADIPASFGGGYVDIRTKSKPKENYLKVTTEVRANSYTGKERTTYEGSATDWMGKDDGYRQIPAQILNDSKLVVGEGIPTFDSANQEIYQKAITNRLFSTFKDKLPYGGKLEVEGAYTAEIADQHNLSFFANYAYGQKHTSRDEEYFKYEYNQATDTLKDDPRQYGITYRSMDTFTNALIANIEYDYADAFSIKYTKLYSKISEKLTKVSDGIANSDDDWKIRYDLNWEERTLDADQINGHLNYKVFNSENKFTFGAEKAQAFLDQPSNYKYAYLKGNAFQIFDEPYLDRYSPNIFLNMTVDDKQTAYYLKNNTEFELFNEGEYLEVGVAQNSKTRESRYNKFQMQKLTSDFTDPLTADIDTIYDERIRNYDGTFRLDISFQPAYWYDAEVEEIAYYGKVMLKPLKNLEILIGARSVDYSQTVYSYTNDENIFTPIYRKAETFEYAQLLPSANIKYSFDKQNILNFAYSQTYIVPDLREFTEAQYFHPYDVATVEGNPDLVNTDITSYDLKFSHYFSDTENIGIGTFYKYLENPIEDVMLPSSSLPRYGYANADNAVLYGIEFDGRKSLDLISRSLKDFYLFGNFSYTKSDVTLTADQEQLYTNNHRELQGLSPTVLNVALGYDTKRRSATLSYNKMGDRIRKVGMVDATDKYPDYYEQPAAVLDFVWIENFGYGLSAKLKLKNLLNEETIWYQGDKSHVTNRFKVGRFYSFALSYKY